MQGVRNPNELLGEGGVALGTPPPEVVVIASPIPVEEIDGTLECGLGRCKCRRDMVLLLVLLPTGTVLCMASGSGWMGGVWWEPDLEPEWL